MACLLRVTPMGTFHVFLSTKCPLFRKFGGMALPSWNLYGYCFPYPWTPRYLLITYRDPEYVETVGYYTASTLTLGQKTGYFRFSGPG